LVKLGTTKEKQLIIDIIALRQSYKSKKLLGIRWINRTNNPTDIMIKAAPNKVLEGFINTNELQIRVEK
jgi:hypothetical protein